MNNVKYDDLLKSNLKYGNDKEKLKTYRGYQGVLENVIIAPWWNHTMFNDVVNKVDELNDKVFNLYGDNFSFTFIELKRIGAPSIMDYVMSLGLTNCKKIIFLGSAGSLDDNIKIGDIVIPEYSVCGDGASRYLNKNLEDEFGKDEIPFGNLNEEIMNTCKKLNIEFKSVKNYSIDSVFCEYNHMDYILNKGVNTIEMETSMVFKASQILEIPASAILCISDNLLKNKTFYSDKSSLDEDRRHYVRNKVIPLIIKEMFKKDNEK